jgi:hypothetical protein
LWPKPQSTPTSEPIETFNHSTHTVPLNFFGSDGRCTITRVVYGAGVVGATAHRPSLPSDAVGAYAFAVPDRKNSERS